jgi:hypothetical protein
MHFIALISEGAGGLWFLENLFTKLHRVFTVHGQSFSVHFLQMMHLCPAFDSWPYICNQQLISNGLLHDELV